MSFERVVLMLIEMKDDKVLLDLPLAEMLVSAVTDGVCDHKGVVSVQVQIQDYSVVKDFSPQLRPSTCLYVPGLYYDKINSADDANYLKYHQKHGISYK